MDPFRFGYTTTKPTDPGRKEVKLVIDGKTITAKEALKNSALRNFLQPNELITKKALHKKFLTMASRSEIPLRLIFNELELIDIGVSLIPLLKCIAKKKVIVNPKNDDQKCGLISCLMSLNLDLCYNKDSNKISKALMKKVDAMELEYKAMFREAPEYPVTLKG